MSRPLLVVVVVVAADIVWVVYSTVVGFPSRLETIFQTMVGALTLALVFVIQHTQAREQLVLNANWTSSCAPCRTPTTRSSPSRRHPTTNSPPPTTRVGGSGPQRSTRRPYSAERHRSAREPALAVPM